MSTVLVVNYNTGNVDSLIKAVKVFNTNVIYSDDENELKKVSKIILPGQGSYSVAVKFLKKKNLYSKIIEKSNRENIPILGICLGMQIMSSFGNENENTEGLNLIPGEVIKLKDYPERTPHIGWNKVNFIKKSSLFNDIENFKDFYFMHSYKFVPKDESSILAESKFNELFVSIINFENNYGIQFHPEKSLTNGLKMIKNFLEIK